MRNEDRKWCTGTASVKYCSAPRRRRGRGGSSAPQCARFTDSLVTGVSGACSAGGALKTPYWQGVGWEAFRTWCLCSWDATLERLPHNLNPSPPLSILTGGERGMHFAAASDCAQGSHGYLGKPLARMLDE